MSRNQPALRAGLPRRRRRRGGRSPRSTRCSPTGEAVEPGRRLRGQGRARRRRAPWPRARRSPRVGATLASCWTPTGRGRRARRPAGAPGGVRPRRPQLAALPYSSGTTGRAKGVMLTHRNLVANLAQFAPMWPYRPDDVVCAVLPMFHIYGMNVIMNLALASGSTIVTLPRFSVAGYLGAVERYRVTRLHLAPPMVLQLVSSSEVADRFDHSSVRWAVSGAAPLDAELAARFEKRFGVPVAQGYGMTEASPGTHLDPRARPGRRPDRLGRLADAQHRGPPRSPRNRSGLRDRRGDLGAGPPGHGRLPQQPRRHRRDADRRRVAPHRRRGPARRRRLLHRRPGEGAHQVQGLPGRPGRARGAAAHASRRRRRGGGGRVRRGRRGEAPKAFVVAPGRSRHRRADGVGRRAGRPVQAHPGGRVHRRDPQVPVGQDPAARASGPRRTKAAP